MRYPDWKRRLNEELMSARKRLWKWGAHDCVTLAARCAQAINGEDYTMSLAEKFAYADAGGAARILHENGLRILIERELGPCIHWAHCGHGDLVLCEYPDSTLFDEILTVHDGAQLIAASERGIRRVPMQWALCGWRIE